MLSKLCQGTIYIPRDGNKAPRPCKHQATTPAGYCVSHDPEKIDERSEAAHEKAMARKHERDRQTAKAFLIPVLSAANKARLRMDSPRAKLGAQSIITLLEEAVLDG